MIRISFIAILFALLCGTACKQEFLLDEPGALVPKTVDQNPSLPSIQVNGAQLHAEAFGAPDSAMVVMLHGGPGGDYRYLLAARQLAENGYYVVFYDQRGSGLSQRFDKDSYTLDIMPQDLDAVIEHYRRSPKQRVFLFGHSWGGMLATAYINAYPGKISGVVMGEPGGFTWEQIIAYTGRVFALNPTKEYANDALYFDQFITGKENDHEELDYKFALLSSADNHSPIGNKGFTPTWRSGAVVNTALTELGGKTSFDWTGKLHLFTTKALFLYSENNRAYGLAHAQWVSGAYPNVQLSLIKGGHDDMMHYSWSQTYPVVLAYLNALKNR